MKRIFLAVSLILILSTGVFSAPKTITFLMTNVTTPEHSSLDVLKAGDTMTGVLVGTGVSLTGNCTAASFSGGNLTGSASLNVLKTGDTMTGTLTNSASGRAIYASGGDIKVVGKTELGASTASATGTGALAVGSSTLAEGNYSVAVGSGSRAYGLYSASFGNSSWASGESSVAFGSNNLAHGTNAIAIGNACIANGTPSIALGQNVTVTGANSCGIGIGSSSWTMTAANALAINGGTVSIATIESRMPLSVNGTIETYGTTNGIKFSDGSVQTVAHGKTKTIVSTRAMNGAAGLVTYGGVGFKPSGLQIITNIEGKQYGYSIGFAGSDKVCNATAYAWNLLPYHNDTYLVYADRDGSTKQFATVESYDADGFDLIWTTSGAGVAETLQLNIMAWQ